MRLIDADKFKQQIATFVIGDSINTQKAVALMDLIDNQPDAIITTECPYCIRMTKPRETKS